MANKKRTESMSSKATSVTDDNSAQNEGSLADSETNLEPLPEGWKEHIDPSSKRPYYVHK
jgi:hypothetical protein